MFSHSPGPFSGTSYSFLVMDSVVLRLVETLEQTKVLVENWVLPHGDENRDEESRGGRWDWVEGKEDRPPPSQE